MQSALEVHVAPGAPAPPGTHSLRGGALFGGTQSTWQVCVAVQTSTPPSAPASGAGFCGLTGSQPGSRLPSGTSGAPPSASVQFTPATSETVAMATPPFLISCVAIPCPIEHPRLFRASTKKSTLPVSPCEKSTDRVFSSVRLMDAP